MSQKYIYLLELYKSRRPTNVGLFTSKKKAETALKKLSKKNQYTIYQLPLNIKLTKGKKLEDRQGVYHHWHYGTYEVEYEKYDKEANLLEKDTRVQYSWPE